jgi:hypothetical protein
MKRILLIVLSLLLLTSPVFAYKQIGYDDVIKPSGSGIEAETAAYMSLPSPGLDVATANTYILAVKYGAGVTLSSVTFNTSNPATSPLFLSNPSVDLRWMKGFYVTISDGTNTLKVLVGTAGTGESYTDIIGGTNPALKNGNFSAGDTVWGKNTNVTISENKALWTAATANDSLSQSNTVIASALYKTTVVYDSITAGTMRPYFTVAGLTKTAAGTYIDYITKAAGDANLYIQCRTTPTTAQVGSIVFQQIITPSLLGVWFSDPTGSSLNYNAASYTVTVTKT